ncbi:hypothetical protein EB093_06365 [bacterium]|nr:hypothetical protein [bacterium]
MEQIFNDAEEVSESYVTSVQPRLRLHFSGDLRSVSTLALSSVFGQIWVLAKTQFYRKIEAQLIWKIFRLIRITSAD